jgi:hypothetical protein
VGAAISKYINYLDDALRSLRGLVWHDGQEFSLDIETSGSNAGGADESARREQPIEIPSNHVIFLVNFSTKIIEPWRYGVSRVIG